MHLEPNECEPFFYLYSHLMYFFGGFKQGILKELKNTGRKYKYVRLADYDTFFWRHQRHAEKCLATCEAIYYFFREFEDARKTTEEVKYDGRYDNLLFYYILQFKTILNAID